MRVDPIALNDVSLTASACTLVLLFRNALISTVIDGKYLETVENMSACVSVPLNHFIWKRGRLKVMAKTNLMLCRRQFDLQVSRAAKPQTTKIATSKYMTNGKFKWRLSIGYKVCERAIWAISRDRIDSSKRDKIGAHLCAWPLPTFVACISIRVEIKNY